MWRPRTRLSARGWRRTAAINAGLATLASIILIVIVACSATAAGSLSQNTVFYEGSCVTSGRINLSIHLLLNIVSTLLIASSNFFMQVLNSPSRAEVDKAHFRGRFLEIGVPSIRNFFYLTPIKSILWLLFLLSSVPIHLSFNSSVFETDYQGSDYFMAIAAESFARGAPHHGPGASLVTLGFIPHDFSDYDPWNHFNLLDNTPTPFADYLNSSSYVSRNLSFVSKSMAAMSWKRLSTEDCRKEYNTCGPRRNYRNVVVVVDTQIRNTPYQASDASGFLVNNIFNMTAGAVKPKSFNHNFTTSQLRDFWEQWGPISQPNPLWFFDRCQSGFFLEWESGCSGNCLRVLGFSPKDAGVTGYEATNNDSSWTLPLSKYDISTDGHGDRWMIPDRPAFNHSNISPDAGLEITHCYAEPIEPTCKVAVLNSLLLTVAMFVMAKAVLCVVTIVLVPGDSLVTPGDAMASFIAHPDPTTEGKATLGRRDCMKERKGRKSLAARSQYWETHGCPRMSWAIPLQTWFATYTLITLALGVSLTFLYMAFQSSSIQPNFDHGLSNGIIVHESISTKSLTSQILIANTPQQIASLCYFAYNAMITRMCAEKEWNSYSLSYQPLRVSYPEEGQISSYRLQIPYRFSVPLLVFSTLLHWLLSNSIYVLVIQGGFVTSKLPTTIFRDETAFVGVGYSGFALLLVFIASGIAALLPLLSLRRLKGNMVVCGNISTVISASCHASTVNCQKWSSEGNNSIEMLPLFQDRSLYHEKDYSGKWNMAVARSSTTNSSEVESSSREDVGDGAALLQLISRSKVRWGEVAMHPEWYAGYTDREGGEVGHLTFGTAEQDVTEPQEGKIYV